MKDPEESSKYGSRASIADLSTSQLCDTLVAHKSGGSDGSLGNIFTQSAETRG